MGSHDPSPEFRDLRREGGRRTHRKRFLRVVGFVLDRGPGAAEERAVPPAPGLSHLTVSRSLRRVLFGTPTGAVAAVRLLLLTGCRPGEMRRLRWCEVKPDRLTLIDAKTGPRHVLLGEAARELLDGLAENASGKWVFPGKGRDEPLTKERLYSFWTKARDAAGIVADARLHDLRHAHASHAVMNGESLHVAGRLLGHRRATTTNRYVHLDDATLSQAAERVAMAIELRLHYSDSTVSEKPADWGDRRA